MNDTNDELEAQIRAALARKRQQQQAQQPAKPAAPPPQPVIVSSGMVRNPVAGQPGAAAPRPTAAAQPAPQTGAQPTARPASQPGAPAPAAQPAVQPAPTLSARPAAPGGMVLDPSERLGGPAAAAQQPSQQPLQQLGPRFATPEAAMAHAAAATVARQQPNLAPTPGVPPAAAPSTEDGRRALGALLARSAQQVNAGDTQIPPPPGQVLGRIGVEQQPVPAGAPAPKEKPFRHPFFSGRRHLWPMLIIPAVSIGVVLVLFYFLIFELGGEGVVDIAPLIEAEQTPLKVRPDEEGGMEEPQDMEIYSEIDGATTPDPSAEQLVPAPEQPVIPATPEVTEAAEPAVPVVEAPSVEAPSVDAGTASTTAAGATEAATTEGAAATETATEAATTEDAAATETATEATPTAEATEPAAAATEAAQPEPVTQEAALPPGAYRVQLAAVRSEDGARATWQELQAKLPELAGLQLHIERIDLGSNGIYYRVQGGPLPDKDAASTLCSRLGSRGQDCLVVNP